MILIFNILKYKFCITTTITTKTMLKVFLLHFLIVI